MTALNSRNGLQYILIVVYFGFLEVLYAILRRTNLTQAQLAYSFSRHCESYCTLASILSYCIYHGRNLRVVLLLSFSMNYLGCLYSN